MIFRRQLYIDPRMNFSASVKGLWGLAIILDHLLIVAKPLRIVATESKVMGPNM